SWRSLILLPELLRALSLIWVLTPTSATKSAWPDKLTANNDSAPAHFTSRFLFICPLSLRIDKRGLVIKYQTRKTLFSDRINSRENFIADCFTKRHTQQCMITILGENTRFGRLPN